MDDNQTADFTSEEAFEGFKSIRYYCEMIGNGFSTEAETNHFSASLALLYRDQNDAVAGVISYNWPVMITAKRRHLLDDGHIGIAKLPTALINGSQKQLEPFGTMLCYAVSSTTKYPASAQAFAAYISSEKSLTTLSEDIYDSVPLKTNSSQELAAINEQLPFTHLRSETAGSENWLYAASDVAKHLIEKKGAVTDEELKEDIRTTIKPIT